MCVYNVKSKDHISESRLPCKQRTRKMKLLMLLEIECYCVFDLFKAEHRKIQMMPDDLISGYESEMIMN